MFAVPGWSVSASTLVQQESEQNPRHSSNGDTLKPKTKRRKTHAVDHKVSSDELQQLWERSMKQNVKKVGAASAKGVRQGKVRIETMDVDVGVIPNVQNSAQQASGVDVQRAVARPQKRPVASTGGVLETEISAPPPLKLTDATNSVRAKQKKRRREHGGRQRSEQDPSIAAVTTASLPSHPPPPPPNLTPLQAKMRNKLTSARFRHLNQILYTTSSLEALALFKASPELFADYHSGFSQQVKEYWPENPVELYVKTLMRRGQLQDDDKSALPRRRNGVCVIADLGCGDAPLARGCQSQIKCMKLKFHNYDLHAPNSFVTVSDICDLPLRDGEADIAVFCLSLMGTNWISFVEEAWRILRADGKGEVWVAEVKSRFGRPGKDKVVENSVGKKNKLKNKERNDGQQAEGNQVFVVDDGVLEQPSGETDISNFVKAFQRRGFLLREGSVEKQNKMFVSMVFTKTGVPSIGKHKGLKWNGRDYQKVHDGRMKYVDSEHEPSLEEEIRALKPCVYKTR